MSSIKPGDWWELGSGERVIVLNLGDQVEVVAQKKEPGFEVEVQDETGVSSSLSVQLETRHVANSKQFAVRLGALTRSGFESLFRQIILADVSSYYKHFHAPGQSAPFHEGERIAYAGRVYDETEMANGAEAILDFWLTAGRFAEKFEREFARRLGVRFSCAVNSGSSANLLAFYALTSPMLGDRRLQSGDEVISVAAGFPTTVSPIIQAGCVPVFVDIQIENGTYNIDVSQLEAAVSPRTRAVMLAHTLGNPFDLDVVIAFCKKHDLYLIEDNCDALGSLYKGKLTGGFGDLSTSSFYPPHHLTMGEGGAVYSRELKWKRIVESLRDWGRDCWCAAGKDNTCNKRFGHQAGSLPFGYDHKYIYSHFGFNLKITDMQAAIGVAQLQKLDSFVERRRSNWKALHEGLKDCEDVLILPTPTPQSEPSWFGFIMSIREGGTETRSALTKFLEARGVQTRMLFAGNLLRQPCFDLLKTKGSGYRAIGELSNTDRAMQDAFWVGVYPGLREGMIGYMIDQIRAFWGR